MTREANEAERHRARTERLAGIAVGGFGIVSLALGGVFTGLANDANHHIVSGDTWNPATYDRRNTYQALDVTFFVVGGAAVAAGAALYLIGRHDEHKRYPVERVEVVPAIGTHVGGLTMQGSF